MFFKIKSIAFTIFTVLAMMSCSNKKDINNLNGGELLNTSWTLSNMPEELPSGVEISLQFEKGKINGKGVCNNYFSNFTTNGNNISFDAIGATKMMCPDHSSIEIKYFDRLAKAQNYGVHNNQLTIQTEGGKLIYTRSPTSSANTSQLENTSWTLMAMPMNIPQGVTISLNFEKAKLNGRGVCNRYFSEYQKKGSALKIGNVGATKMMCENHNPLETQYFELLKNAEKFDISNNTLTIQTKNGNLVFVKNSTIGMNEPAIDTKSFSGTYVTEGFPNKYFQKLNISPLTDGYKVVVSASKVKGRSGCSFEGIGKIKDQTLIVPITFKDKKVNMVLTQEGENLKVFTQNFDNRFALMHYCSGGGSLAGNYMPQPTSADFKGLVLDEKKLSKLELTDKNLLGEKKLKQIFPEMKISKKTAQTEASNYDYFLVENTKEKFRINLRKTKKQDFQQINSVVIDSPSIPDVYGIQTGMTFKDIKSKRPNLMITTDSHFHTIAHVKGSNIRYEICCNTSQPDKTSWSEKEVEDWKVRSIIWKTS